MSRWLNGFFENNWLRLVRQNSTTGGLEVSGTTITGVAEYTFAEMTAMTGAQIAALGGIYVNCTDRHNSAEGIGGSLWIVDVTAQKFVAKEPIYYATFDLLPSAATWPGLRVIVGSGVGLGGALMVSRSISGTYYWRYMSGSAILKCLTADVLHTTDFSVEKIAASLALPINNSKSIMQNFDTLDIRAVIGRTAYVTSVTRNLRFGTASSGIGNTLIEGLNYATSHTLGEYMTIMRRSSTSLFQMGAASSGKWAGASGSDTYADDTVTNIDSAIMYLDYGIIQSANTNEGVALEALIIQLNHTGG